MASPTFTINGVPCSAYMEDELVESYSYVNMRVNSGLTAAAFNY